MKVKKKEKLLIDLTRIEGMLQNSIEQLTYSLKDVQETVTSVQIKSNRESKEKPHG